MAHDVQWYSPAPFWPKRLQNGTRDRLQQPALLEFQQDNFMKALTTTLEDAPNTLPTKRADRDEENEEPAADEANKPGIPLYQPAHERYYLVTASLVCRERGLPDRAVDTANEERAAFVLRRIEPIDSQESQTLLSKTGAVQPVKVKGKKYIEYGWTGTAWKPVKDPTEAAKEEKRLSMFPKNYAPKTPVETMKGKRRVWAGLLPVAKRETFETAPVRSNTVLGAEDDGGEEEGGAGTDSPSGGSSGSLPPANKPSDPRKAKFETRIIGAFDRLRRRLEEDAKKGSPSLTAEDVRDPLLFAWLDLWQFLKEHLSKVANEIRNPDGDVDLGDRDQEVLRVLNTIDVTGVGLGKEIQNPKAADALREIADNAGHLEAGNPQEVLAADELPGSYHTNDDRKFELNRRELANAIDQVLARTYAEARGEKDDADSKDNEGTPLLKKKVYAALGPLTDPGILENGPQPPTAEPVGGGEYVVHCLYERPNCPEPLRREVSAPSSPFRMASFFDAKAPPRDINITLPSASLKDLRGSSQSVTMQFTKELRKQAKRAQEVALDEIQGKDSSAGVDLGMICSLSIPIITICALILLLIMVVLLNIVFWWLPFFKICLPFPKSS